MRIHNHLNQPAHKTPPQALTRRAHVVEEGVVILCPQEGAGEHHSVEGNIVLGHELVLLDLRGCGGGGGAGVNK